MMKNYLLILGIISIFLVSACTQQSDPVPIKPQPAVIEAAEDDIDEQPEAPSQEPIQAETPVPGQEPVVEDPVVEPSQNVKEFDIIAKQWDFTPSVIAVDVGDKVILNINDVDVSHGFTIFEFGVNERLTPGKTTRVEFIADKAGEYTFLCSVPCGRGHSGMRGTLVVQ